MTDVDRRQLEYLMETWKEVMNDHGINCPTFLDQFESKEKLMANSVECFGTILRIDTERFQIIAKKLTKSMGVPLKNLLEAHTLFDCRYIGDLSRYLEAHCTHSLASMCKKLPKWDMTLGLDENVKVIRPNQVQVFLNKVSIIQTFIQDDVIFVVCCLLTLLIGENNPHPIYKWLQKLLFKLVSNDSHTFPNADEAIKDVFKNSKELFQMLSPMMYSFLPSEE